MNEPTLPTEEDVNERAVAGDNVPPKELPYDLELFAALEVKTKAFIDISNTWLKTEINSDRLSRQLTDQIGGLNMLGKTIKAERVNAKKPILENGRTIDAAFNGLLEKVIASIDALNPRLAVYVDQKAKEDEVVRQENIKEADHKSEIARQQTYDAEQSGKIEDKVEAESAEKKAAKQVKDAAKPVVTNVKSESGAGRTMSQRKRKSCEITNVRTLFMHFQTDPAVHDVLLRLANAEANGKDFPKDGTIPGTTITETTKLV